MIVTNLKWKNKSGEERQGYYLDNLLVEHMDGCFNIWKKDLNVKGIISSQGKQRMGLSTMAMQVGYYLAWKMAGGEMEVEKDNKNCGSVLKEPTKPINFSSENIVDNKNDLLEKAKELPKNSVIIYKAQNEDPSIILSLINEVNKYGHLLLIAIPNFFKLTNECATALTAFLINVHHDEDYNRGHFDFYGMKQKEKLCIFGKKMDGITSQYSVTSSDIKGKFTQFLPITI